MLTLFFMLASVFVLCALVFLIITPSLTFCFPNKLLIACQRIFPRTNSLGASNLTCTKYPFYMVTGWICFLHCISESDEVDIHLTQHCSWVQGGCLLIVWQWRIDHQGNLTVEVPVDWSTVTQPINPLHNLTSAEKENTLTSPLTLCSNGKISTSSAERVEPVSSTEIEKFERSNFLDQMGHPEHGNLHMDWCSIRCLFSLEETTMSVFVWNISWVAVLSWNIDLFCLWPEGTDGRVGYSFIQIKSIKLLASNFHQVLFTIYFMFWILILLIKRKKGLQIQTNEG